MEDKFKIAKNEDIAWCPGCGNFSLLRIIQSALKELDMDPKNTVISSGIGQAAKMPQYIDLNFYNGLHGRGLPVAVAIKMANPNLNVIEEGGDGAMYGEGGNQFLRNVKRNPDIVHLVHDNQVYGLTKGQGSPTSSIGQKTSLQLNGVTSIPFNPIAVAISLGATFVAKAFTGDMQGTKEIIKAAIQHKGYALVDIFDPCPSFNKTNTFKWYQEHTYKLEGHDPADREKALKLAFDDHDREMFGLGIIYKREDIPTQEDNMWFYKDSKKPLYERKAAIERVLHKLGM